MAIDIVILFNKGNEIKHLNFIAFFCLSTMAKLYVPAKAVFESLGYGIDFDSNANTLKLSSPENKTVQPENEKQKDKKSTSANTIPDSFPANETANYSITLLNLSEEEVQYSFTVTIKNLGS